MAPCPQASLNITAMLVAGNRSASELEAICTHAEGPDGSSMEGCGLWTLKFDVHDKGTVGSQTVGAFVKGHPGVQGLQNCWVVQDGELHSAEYFQAGAWLYISRLGNAVRAGAGRC